MGIFDWLNKAQNHFDENWIMGHKEHWKSKFQSLSKTEMEAKLKEIESHGQFDSTESAKKAFWAGTLGSITHITDREKESQRRALRELLGLEW